MQKSWSITTSSGPSVGASTLLCDLTPVDRGIPGSPSGTTALSSMQTIIVLFRFSTINCFRYWYRAATYPASRWCNLAIQDCTLNWTLKRPVNLWAIFTWAFIEWNCSLRDSTLGIQPGINCHPHFYCVNYSKPWKKILGVDGFVDCWRDTAGTSLKIYFGAAVKNRGGDFIYFNLKTGKLGGGGKSIDLTIKLVSPSCTIISLATIPSFARRRWLYFLGNTIPFIYTICLQSHNTRD